MACTDGLEALAYTAAVLYNAALWLLWDRIGWKLSDHVQFFLVPVGFSTILFAEVIGTTSGRENVNTIRTVGLLIIYGSLALPIWQFATFGVAGALGGIAGGDLPGHRAAASDLPLAGPGHLRARRSLRNGAGQPRPRIRQWAVACEHGIGLVLFVALNEKKIVATMQSCWVQARQWE